MKTHKNILYRVGFYPLLLGLYPVLYLWLANFYKVPAYVVPRSLLVAESIAIAAYLFAWLILRSPRKAAAFSGLFLTLFFFYGHVYTLLDNARIVGVELGQHRLLLFLWLLFFVCGTVWIVRSRSDFLTFTWAANLIIAFLVGALLVQIGFQVTQSPRPVFARNSPASPARAGSNSSSPSSTQPGPDIYYILLDSYARQDMLKSDFKLDNSDFIKQLIDLGFVVPDCAQSNYNNTSMSMSTIFNMDYLDKLGFPYNELAFQEHEKTLTPLIQNNLVFNKLKQAGYQLITFKSLYPPVDFKDQADIYYDLEQTTGASDKLETLLFQNLFLKTTLLKTVTDYEKNYPQMFEKVPPQVLQIIDPTNDKFDSHNYRQYQQNLYALDKLEQTPKIPGKKFVYAHLFLTHQPFTFTPDGSFRMTFRDSYDGYRDQVLYANARILPIVKTILKESATPPIIVIQGDHNFTFTPEKQFKNLNALYLPDGGSAKVYPQITLVNTFRLIFSYYFNESYPFLPDVSTLVDKKYPGGYKIIPGSCVN